MGHVGPRGNLKDAAKVAAYATFCGMGSSSRPRNRLMRTWLCFGIAAGAIPQVVIEVGAYLRRAAQKSGGN
jgi:hypothetical protein